MFIVSENNESPPGDCDLDSGDPLVDGRSENNESPPGDCDLIDVWVMQDTAKKVRKQRIPARGL